MRNEINLLPSLQTETESSGTLKILRILAIGSLLFMLSASVILFLLSQQLSPFRLKKQEKEILYNLSQLHQKEAKLFVVNDRAKSISGIIAGRHNYGLWMDVFLKQIPSDASINSMTINKDKITLTASSKSLLSINTLLNNLIELAKGKKIIKDITIDGLTADVKNGGYSLSISSDTL